MNLQHKRVRLPIAALGVTALVCAGGALANPAFAAGTTLAFGPTASSATIVNVEPGASDTLAGLTYGLKVTGLSGSDPTYVNVLSAPTDGMLYQQRVSGNGLPEDNANASQVVNAEPVNVVAATTAGQATITTSASAGDNFSADDLAGHLVRIGTGANTQYAVVTAGGATANITLDRKMPATNAGQAFFTLGPASTSKFFIPVAAEQAVPLAGYTNGDNVYFGATVPGTYTFRLFQDHNGNGEFEADQDDTTPTFTLTVRDVTGETSSTADDLAFNVTAPASAFVGNTVTATATPALSFADTRGSVSGRGVLGAALGDLIDMTITPGATGAGTGGATTFTGTAFTRPSNATSAAGSMSFQPSLDLADDYIPTSQAVSTVVGSNSVATVVLDATEVANAVTEDTGAVTVKAGTTAVTYTATAKNATPVAVSGAVVNFTVAGSAPNIAKLTFSGTPVDVSSTTSKVYSATTNSSGVASLTVTSSTPVAADTYTVDATTNAVNGTPQLTATYQDLAATTIETTNTAAELTPTVASGMSVTLKGKILDQFGAMYTPTGSQSSQAHLFMGTAGSTCAAEPVVHDTTLISAATATAPITAGTFSSVFTPSTTPTAGHCQKFSLVYNVNGDTNVDNGEWVTGTIQYASTTVASSVVLNTPNDAATGINLQDSTAPDNTQAGGATDFGDVHGEVKGVVYDANTAPLAFKSVTLTGGAGVYFTTADPMTTVATDDLTPSVTVVTNSAGEFSGAYAYFTKSGTVKVTATSGTVSDEATVTTDNATERYKVTVNALTGAPGSTLILTGTAKDAFDNPVVGGEVNLSIGSSTLGALGDTSPETNAAGVFSTTFTSGSNQSGVADLTATIPGATANPTAATEWLTLAGKTIAAGKYTDTATITLTETKLTLSATANLTAGARGATAKISGMFKPNTSVDIYTRASGMTSFTLADAVETDADGAFEAEYRITKSTSFLAKSGSATSRVATTQVRSKVSLTARAMGDGKVRLTANGDPNARATLTFYRSVAGPDIRLRRITSSSLGTGSVTVTLPKGTRSVYVTYGAPGTTRGKSKTIKLRVR